MKHTRAVSLMFEPLHADAFVTSEVGGTVTAAWFENDELFFDELSTGHRFTELVATRLRERGVAAEVTPMERRRTIDDRGEFSSEIDLFAGTDRKPIEVKSRQLTFGTDPRSYPYRTAFVDTVSGWDAKTRKPVAVVLVSQLTQEMLVVPPSRRAHWTVERKHDRVRNITDSWYCAPRGYLRTFDQFVEWLLPDARSESTGPTSLDKRC